MTPTSLTWIVFFLSWIKHSKQSKQLGCFFILAMPRGRGGGWVSRQQKQQQQRRLSATRPEEKENRQNGKKNQQFALAISKDGQLFLFSWSSQSVKDTSPTLLFFLCLEAVQQNMGAQPFLNSGARTATLCSKRGPKRTLPGLFPWKTRLVDQHCGIFVLFCFFSVCLAEHVTWAHSLFRNSGARTANNDFVQQKKKKKDQKELPALFGLLTSFVGFLFSFVFFFCLFIYCQLTYFWYISIYWKTSTEHSCKAPQLLRLCAKNSCRATVCMKSLHNRSTCASFLPSDLAEGVFMEIQKDRNLSSLLLWVRTIESDPDRTIWRRDTILIVTDEWVIKQTLVKCSDRKANTLQMRCSFTMYIRDFRTRSMQGCVLVMCGTWMTIHHEHTHTHAHNTSTDRRQRERKRERKREREKEKEKERKKERQRPYCMWNLPHADSTQVCMWARKKGTQRERERERCQLTRKHTRERPKHNSFDGHKTLKKKNVFLPFPKWKQEGHVNVLEYSNLVYRFQVTSRVNWDTRKTSITPKKNEASTGTISCRIKHKTLRFACFWVITDASS